MNFTKYSSIENAYRNKTINLIRMNGYSDKNVTWCATEKIHGSNFSVWTNGEYTRFGKRSGLISSHENFYGYQSIAGKLVDQILAFKQRYYPFAEEIAFHGELYGGLYNHSDVERVLSSQQVQSGVSYRPDTGFRVFDVRVDGRLINYQLACIQLASLEIEYARILFEGTMDECLKYPNEFQTKIPAELGLPEVENNICEGVVLKPLEPAYIGMTRVILKNKNDKFGEIEKKGRKVAKLADVKVGEEGQEILSELASYANENRLSSVLSKESSDDIHWKNFGPLLGKFMVDIFEDFNKDTDFALAKIDSKEQKVIKKTVSTIASNMLREHMKGIV